MFKRLAPLALAAALTALVSAAALSENRGQTTFSQSAGCAVEKIVVCPRFYAL